MGLSVVTCELPLIDLHELGRLNICLRISGTWAWVASGPERQPDATAGALGASGDALPADEGTQADLAPVQAPQRPPPAPKTIQQRVSRLEEEVQELRRSIVGLRGDVVRSITNQSTSQLPYQRRTRRRTEGQAPEKVIGVNLFYLCSMDRGTANVSYLLVQYMFRHAEGRKSRARLFGGHFIRCLAAYFRLISNQGLMGLLVVTCELPLIDLHELGRLNICFRISGTWAWVASGPERQPDAAAGALGASGDALPADEGTQADLAPV
nr:hypothetical protein [Tanacetum cinerariifolium]